MRSLLCAVFLVSLGTAAHASKPIPYTMKGCVLAGVFYSVDKDNASIVKPMGDKPLDVSKLDGKHIEVAGLLYPGDYFKSGDAPPTVKGACTAASRKAIEYAKAHDLRMQAARLAKDKPDEALELVEASIKHVQPADCDTFIDRAHLRARKKDLASAARDLDLLKARKCRFRGSLNWLLLQELAAELRAQGADKTAVLALTLALANCNSDICKPDIERDLAAARKAANAKK